MATVRALVTIKSGGKYHPPGTILDVDDADAAGLKGYVAIVGETETSVAALAAGGGETSSGTAGAGDGTGGEGDGDASGGDGGGESRVEAIKAAIDLLDPEKDFVKTGARAGKPKIDALSAALGFKPDEVEIDAALALREGE